ncbi:MAG: phosphatase PAP2 family protein [Dehalococcoidia bacterium]
MAALACLVALFTYFAVTTDRAPFDLRISRWMQTLDLERTGAFSSAMFWMGLRGVAGAVLVVVFALLWLRGHRPAAVFLGLIVVFDLFNVSLREWIGRPRPTEELIGVVIGYGGIQGSSFPSGHAVHFILFYGFMLYLSRTLMRAGALRTLAWALVLFYIPVASIWLVHAGRHWTTDVLGGYAYGAFYLAITIIGYEWFRAYSPRLSAYAEELGPDSYRGKVVRLIAFMVTEGPQFSLVRRWPGLVPDRRGSP